MIFVSNPIISLPLIALEVISKLEDAGYEAYLVGGWVRDKLLGIESKDIDIATSAQPEQTKSVFKDYNVLDFGEKHGTVVLHYRHQNIEITTFRIEGEYSDGRRPDSVIFVDTLEEDLSRRDFTINALAVNREGVIFDYFNGLDHLRNSIIATVGVPDLRFNEDALRILRAVRFALRLGFKIAVHTRNAIRSNRDLIQSKKISGERIYTELQEIFRYSKNAMHLLHELDLITILFPPLAQHNNMEDFVELSGNLPSDKPLLQWSWVVHTLYLEKQEMSPTTTTNELFSRYPGLSNYRQEYISTIVKHADKLRWVVNKPTTMEMKFYIVISLGKLERFPSFNRIEYIKDLIEFSRVIHHLVLHDRYEAELLQIASSLEYKRIYRGDQAKSQGFQGKQIGWVLDEVRLYHLWNENVDLPSLTKFVEDLKKNQLIQIRELREELSRGQPSYSPLENHFVIRSIKRRIRISRIEVVQVNYSQEDRMIVEEIKTLNLKTELVEVNS